MNTLLIVLLVLLVLGGGGYYVGPWNGGQPSNIVGLVVAVLVIALLLRLLGIA